MELTMTTIVRDITDVGIRLEANLPAGWTEIELEDAVLVVGGRLEDAEQTIVPSVQVRVMRAEDEQQAAAAVTGVTEVVHEAKVLFQRTGEGSARLHETVAEVAHRKSVTHATLISMFRAIHPGRQASGCQRRRHLRWRRLA